VSLSDPPTPFRLDPSPPRVYPWGSLGKLIGAAALALGTCCASVLAGEGLSEVQQVNTVNGLSGYLFAPNARIAPRGTASLDYTPSVPGADRLDGHNLSVLFPLTSQLEVAGRVAANTLQCNMYLDSNCGMRDLSASGKFGFHLQRLINREPFSRLWLAAGATDVGGAATSFRSYFTAATYIGGRWEATLGAARGEPGVSQHMPLDGWFAGAAWQAKPWLRLHAEQAGAQAFIGALATDDQILPALGFPTGSRMHAQLNVQLSGVRETEQPHISFGFRVPMNGTLTSPGALSTTVSRFVPWAGSNRPSSTDAGSSTPKILDPSDAQSLAEILFAQGFTDIYLGEKHQGQTRVLSLNNMAYSHSELDALGVALGHLAFASDSKAERYQLVLHRWNVPVALVEGDLACLRGWLKATNPCVERNALRIRLTGLSGGFGRGLRSLLGEVVWAVEGAYPAWHKLRLHLGPNAHYTFATEYGIWDHSVGLGVAPWWHLWPGAMIEGFRTAHVASTRDYEGGIFSFWRVRSGNGRLMLHQVFQSPVPPPQFVGGQFSGRLDLGRPLEDWFGGGAELRWDSQSGRHAMILSGHRYLYQGPFVGFGPGTPSFAAYRYAVPNTDWQLEATVGRWWNKDRSFSVASRHWFGDLNLGFVVHAFEDARPLWFGGREVAFAAIELSFPLTLRREVHTGQWPVEIRGLPRYALSLGTTVGRTDNAFVGAGGFPLYAHLGIGPGVPFSTGAILRDFDRLNMAYLPFHLNRIRYAFERWTKPYLSPRSLSGTAFAQTDAAD